jgi:CRISPR-associated endonuclease/helicase Cas3
MYFPVRVCTPHQILTYSLQGKGWESMLSEFPNSVFIFDEIHSYDPIIVGLVIATAKFVLKLGASVMFLSAILPSFIRKLIENEIPNIQFIQPDIIQDRQILEQKRHHIVMKKGNVLDNIDLIVKQSKRVKSTLIVCNYVKVAQEFYLELKKRIDDVVLLHSQFNRKDRNRIEDGIMKRLPKVLVSTQAIEVSLDLDKCLANQLQ